MSEVGQLKKYDVTVTYSVMARDHDDALEELGKGRGVFEYYEDVREVEDE